jgi:hypothetical protein
MMKWGAALAAALLMTGQAHAAGLFENFLAVCGDRTGGVQGVAAAADSRGWKAANPADLNLTRTGITASPKAVARVKDTEQGRIELLADEITLHLPAPYPPTVTKRTCLVGISAYDPSVIDQVRAWLGPEVSARGKPVPPGEAVSFEATRENGKFTAIPADLQPSDPKKINAETFLVMPIPGASPSTGILELGPGL